MQENIFKLHYARFHGIDDRKIVFQGCFQNETPECVNAIEITLDGKKVVPEVITNDGMVVRQRYSVYPFRVDTEYCFIVQITEEVKKIVLTNITSDGKRTIICNVDIPKMLENRKKINYSIDEVKSQDGKVVIKGWAITKNKLEATVVEPNGKKKVRSDLEEVYRTDVVSLFPEVSEKYVNGFKLKCDGISEKKLEITFIDGKYTEKLKVSLTQKKMLLRKAKHIIGKGYHFYRKYGLSETAKKIYTKVRKIEVGVDYNKWIREKMPTENELKSQRAHKFVYNPKISVVIPLYKTPKKFLRELIFSLQEQTYTNWEVCFSDGSGLNSPLTKILEEYTKKDSRIKVIASEKPLQISENTNEAIKIATGDYIAFSDHDDLLSPDAFYEFVKLFNQYEDVEAAYSDEDKISMDGKQYFQPHFKPDFNEDLLNTNNYICHLFMARKDLVEKVGYLNPEYNGSQDYDFILRCSEKAKHIYHIPKILYHWRMHKDSTAENPENKLYCFEAARKAIEAHYERIGVKATVTQTEYYGIYRTKYELIGEPKVSIIIPNKDHIEDLEKCLNSIIEKEKYLNYEIIIVENNSEKEETFDYYRQVEQKNDKIKIVYWEKEFNYSAINNFGVQYASGDYLLFLNNDTKIINADCIEEMLGYCQREDVGVVGARLYYPDETIQHAGVVIGVGGTAGHIYLNTPRGQIGYFAGIICAQDYNAVTAACMMTKKELFEKVGGFEEKLAVAYNDVDYCLKIRDEKKLVVYNPFAELYHFESKSRKAEDTRNKVRRLEKETELFESKWKKYYENGDGYYNPNFSRDSLNFNLAK